MSDDKYQEPTPPEADKPDAEAAWRNHKEFQRDMRRLQREELRKKYPLLGTAITLNPEHHDAVESITLLMRSADEMLISGAQLKREYTKKLWELVRTLYPETEGYALSMNYASKRVNLTGVDEE